jgi:excisionase family DNA binding protein
VRSDIQPESRLLTPAEVAALFRVDPKTVTRWAQQGKIRSIRTLGGHRRYSESEIQAFLDKSQQMPVPRTSPQGRP